MVCAPDTPDRTPLLNLIQNQFMQIFDNLSVRMSSKQQCDETQADFLLKLINLMHTTVIKLILFIALVSVFMKLLYSLIQFIIESFINIHDLFKKLLTKTGYSYEYDKSHM